MRLFEVMLVGAGLLASAHFILGRRHPWRDSTLLALLLLAWGLHAGREGCVSRWLRHMRWTPSC